MTKECSRLGRNELNAKDKPKPNLNPNVTLTQPNLSNPYQTLT